jgi:hypothetical protein
MKVLFLVFHSLAASNEIGKKISAAKLDRIVTFTDQDYIYGQKTIQISNGIDFDPIPLRKPGRSEDDTIHLLGVAEMHYWHGVDRGIAGLRKKRFNPEDIRSSIFHLAWRDYLYGVPFYKRLLLYFKKQCLSKNRLSECLTRLKPDITLSLLRRDINFINQMTDGS